MLLKRTEVQYNIYLYVKTNIDFKCYASYFHEDGSSMSLLNGGSHPPYNTMS